MQHAALAEVADDSANTTGTQRAEARAMMAAVDAQLATIGGNGQSARRGSLRSKLDEDTYDAVRLEDLRRMVGAWRIGRVTDTKFARYSCYDGGPADAAFALTVDVNLQWFPVCGQPNRDAYWRALEALGVKKQAELEKQARERRGVPRTGPTKSDTEGPPLGRLDADGRNANPTLLALFGRGVIGAAFPDAPCAPQGTAMENLPRVQALLAMLAKIINTYAAAQAAQKFKDAKGSGPSGKGGAAASSAAAAATAAAKAAAVVKAAKEKQKAESVQAIALKLAQKRAAEAAQVAAQASVEASDAAQAAEDTATTATTDTGKAAAKLEADDARQAANEALVASVDAQTAAAEAAAATTMAEVRAARQKAIAAAARAQALEADAKASAKAAEQAAAAEEALARQQGENDAKRAFEDAEAAAKAANEAAAKAQAGAAAAPTEAPLQLKAAEAKSQAQAAEAELAKADAALKRAQAAKTAAEAEQAKLEAQAAAAEAKAKRANAEAEAASVESAVAQIENIRQARERAARKIQLFAKVQRRRAARRKEQELAQKLLAGFAKRKAARTAQEKAAAEQAVQTGLQASKNAAADVTKATEEVADAAGDEVATLQASVAALKNELQAREDANDAKGAAEIRGFLLDSEAALVAAEAKQRQSTIAVLQSILNAHDTQRLEAWNTLSDRALKLGAYIKMLRRDEFAESAKTVDFAALEKNLNAIKELKGKITARETVEYEEVKRVIESTDASKGDFMVQAATAKKQLKAFEDQDVVALTNEEEQAYQDEIAETDNFLLVVPERQEGETRQAMLARLNMSEEALQLREKIERQFEKVSNAAVTTGAQYAARLMRIVEAMAADAYLNKAIRNSKGAYMAADGTSEATREATYDAALRKADEAARRPPDLLRYDAMGGAWSKRDVKRMISTLETLKIPKPKNPNKPEEKDDPTRLQKLCGSRINYLEALRVLENMRREAYDTWAASEEGSAALADIQKFGEEYKTLSNAVTVALKALDDAKAGGAADAVQKAKEAVDAAKKAKQAFENNKDQPRKTKLGATKYDTKKDRLDAANGLLKQVEGIDYSEQEAKVREALEKTDEEAKAVSTSLSEEDAFNLVADVAALFERRTSVNSGGVFTDDLVGESGLAYSIVEEVLTKPLADVPWNDNTAALSGATFLLSAQGEDNVRSTHSWAPRRSSMEESSRRDQPKATRSSGWCRIWCTSSTFSTPSRFQPARASS